MMKTKKDQMMGILRGDSVGEVIKQVIKMIQKVKIEAEVEANQKKEEQIMVWRKIVIDKILIMRAVIKEIMTMIH